MRKNVLMTLVLMAAMMGTAFAAEQTAFCPNDGELAQWTGSQKGAYPNQVCEYKHFFFDHKTKRVVKHVFWHEDRQFEALLRRAARFQKSGQPLPPVDGGRQKGEA
jgi:hypothetical protein